MAIQWGHSNWLLGGSWHDYSDCGGVSHRENASESLIRDNAGVLEQCRKYGIEYTLIDGTYQADMGGGAE